MPDFAIIISLLLFFEIYIKGSYSIKIVGLKESYEISEGAPGRTLFKLRMWLDISNWVYKEVIATVISKKDSSKQACALYKLKYNRDRTLELTLDMAADYEIESQRVCIGAIRIEIDCKALSAPGDKDCGNDFQKPVILQLNDEVQLDSMFLHSYFLSYFGHCMAI